MASPIIAGNSARPFSVQISQSRCQIGAQEVSRLLDQHQMLVFSGASRDNLSLNTKIGKSSFIRSFLIPELEVKGTVEYKNMLLFVDLESYIQFAELKIFPACGDELKALPDADFYIFDDAHPFVYRPNSGGTDNIEDIYFFWEKVKTLAKAGKKIIFVSALHPEDPYFKKNGIYSPVALDTFFSAPVVEVVKGKKLKVFY